MFNSFVFSQILVVISYILLGIGFLSKTKLKILKYSICFNVFMIIHYILLNGTMGIVSSIVNTSRSVYFAINEKRGKENPKYSLIFFIGISVILGVLFYSQPIDIVPCVLAIIWSYTYWNSNTKIVRICNLICSLCYIIYAIYLNSWMVIICELYLSIATILGFIKHEKMEVKEDANGEYIDVNKMFE